MARKTLIFTILGIFIISLGGCATARKQKDLENQGLRNHVSVLESQVQSKDEEINALRDALARIEQEKGPTEGSVKKARRKKVVVEIKSRPNIKQIQIALKNAGLEPGPIDGRMGRQTREAIRAFQRAHNLPADGKVGKLTWNLLSEYLYKKIK
jgi:murein L,D-transpeptidase YcbB/YkuD